MTGATTPRGPVGEQVPDRPPSCVVRYFLTLSLTVLEVLAFV